MLVQIKRQILFYVVRQCILISGDILFNYQSPICTLMAVPEWELWWTQRCSFKSIIVLLPTCWEPIGIKIERLRKVPFFLSFFFFLFIRTLKVTREKVKDNKSVTPNVSAVIYRNGIWEHHRSIQSKHIDGRPGS